MKTVLNSGEAKITDHAHLPQPDGTCRN